MSHGKTAQIVSPRASRPVPPGRLASACAGVAVVVVAATVAACASSDAAPPTPNPIVLVSVDTLRADRLSLYGHDRPTSPFLEELARDAVVFDSFVANGGGTLPSHLTMMTSLHPGAHGVTPDNGRVLDPGEETLAERLRAAGYTTAAFVDSGWMRGRFGFLQGFDVYDDAGGHLEAILPKARRWLERHGDRRFFLFLHTYDVHSKASGPPYHCPGDAQRTFLSEVDAEPPDWDSWGGTSRRLAQWNEEIRAGRITAGDVLDPGQVAHMSALYDGCIRYVDERLRELVATLRDMGLYDRSLLVVTSDHGEEFAEHGHFMHTQGGYEEVVRIPLVVKLPFARGGGRRVEGLAAMVDLMPTLLELAGLPPGAGAQGRSLVPAILAGRGTRQGTHLQGAVRTQTWKFIDGDGALYDLAADPRETVDVSAERPDVAARLDAYLTARKAADREWAERPRGAASRVELSAEERRHLEALGYLQ